MWQDVPDNEVLISIHALREEGDGCRVCRTADSKISIHALREEGDPNAHGPFYEKIQFLSTPSARRATLCRKRLSKN